MIDIIRKHEDHPDSVFQNNNTTNCDSMIIDRFDFDCDDDRDLDGDPEGWRSLKFVDESSNKIEQVEQIQTPTKIEISNSSKRQQKQQEQQQNEANNQMMQNRLELMSQFRPTNPGDSVPKVRRDFEQKLNDYSAEKCRTLALQRPYYDQSVVDILESYPRQTEKLISLISLGNEVKLLKFLSSEAGRFPRQSDMRDADGNTPLMIAVKRSLPNTFDILWDWCGGQSDTILNNYGEHLRTMIYSSRIFNYGGGKYQNYFNYQGILTTFLMGVKDPGSSVHNYFAEHVTCDQNNLLNVLFSFVRPTTKFRDFLTKTNEDSDNFQL